MIERNLVSHLQLLASQMPAVAVTGPRQSGKTTLCRATFPNLEYVSLEPLDIRDFALSDPRGFLARYRAGAVLDEVQRAPALFTYLQEELDRDPTPGRFILTGPQDVCRKQAITQSLAGPVGLVDPPAVCPSRVTRFGTPPDAP